MKRERFDACIPVHWKDEDDKMDEQRNQSLQINPSDRPHAAREAHATAPTAEPLLRQLDAIIENMTNFATPVLREIAARAAELAATAGQAAGPMAQKAAERTDEVGDLVASKSRAFASDLRSDGPSATVAEDTARASSEDLVGAMTIQRSDVPLDPDDEGIGSVRPEETVPLDPDDEGIGSVRPEETVPLDPDDEGIGSVRPEETVPLDPDDEGIGSVRAATPIGSPSPAIALAGH
jgi:hypothetical protein